MSNFWGAVQNRILGFQTTFLAQIKANLIGQCPFAEILER